MASVVLITFFFYAVKYFVNKVDLETITAKLQREWLNEFLNDYGFLQVLIVLNILYTIRQREPFTTWLRGVITFSLIIWFIQVLVLTYKSLTLY